MHLYLFRCPECSNIKAFSIYQIRDFPGGIICNMLVNNHMRICGGIMKEVDVDLLDTGGISFKEST